MKAERKTSSKLDNNLKKMLESVHDLIETFNRTFPEYSIKNRIRPE